MRWFRWPRWSIRATLLASIVLGVVLPALLVLALDGWLAHRTQEPIAERSRAAVMALSTAMLTEPAWTLSEPALQAALQRILDEPSVCGAQVLDLQPAAAPLGRDSCAPTPAPVELERAVMHEGQTIARLRLRFDGTEVDRLLAERRTMTAWLVSAQVLVGVVVLAGVLSVRLLRPIDALKDQAGSLAGPADTHGATGHDELGQLGQHLSAVHTQLHGLIAELEAKNAQLERLALYDHLTGLPNRTLLRELFGHEAATARRDGHTLALLFVDLDQFKSVNDAHGHAAGDELLVTVAHRLREALRQSDIVARMSGDEFLVLLPRIDSWRQAAAMAERLAGAIGQPMLLAGVALRLRASIGIALYPADGNDFDALMHAADVAMYRSKAGGRGRYRLYHPEMDSHLQARLALERELEQAVARNQLRLHYQPMVDARSGRVIGAEALVRWQHPQRGLLGPDAFIPAAESTGLIQPLGRWVLGSACVQLAAWRQQGHTLHMAINVSALQLHEPSFVDEVRDALRLHGLPAGALTLELTESTLLADSDGVPAAVAALRSAGAQLAIDDFGTGYASLSSLKLLRPEQLKIDRSFVHDLPERADDCALAEAIFGMAGALGVAVVAEGVETAAQRDWLCARGAWRQQGYLWSRPLPAAEFEALLVPLVL